MKTIFELAKELNLSEKEISPYGWYMGKIDYEKVMERLKDRPNGKLVLVTACCNAEVAGMGKTSTEIAVGQALHYLGKKAIACLREPSLGVSENGKGGATGALKASVIPSDDINCYFTGDIYALTTVINLIASQIDNTIYWGNELNIDPNKIVWNRALDICDRTLRNVTVGQGDKKQIPHHYEFVITVAHELSTIMTLAKDENDFIERTKKAIVAYTYDNKPITIADLKMEKAIRKLMHNALMPNLVQTTSGAAAIIHATPFGNISIGCSSTIATKLALKLADYVFVENGFASELSCEKHLDLVLPSANLKPDAILAVTSCRSLKYQGGHDQNSLEEEDVEAVKAGLVNMVAHIKHLRNYNIPIIVAINKFSCDTEAELKVITDYLDKEKLPYAISNGPIEGETGSVDLANVLTDVLENTSIETYHTLYSWEEPIKTKIEKICKKAYGATTIEYTELADKQIEEYTKRGYGNFPIVMCKTPASITDNQKVLGAPKEHTIHIKEVRLFAGAGFLVPISGSILLLPGGVKTPRLRDDWKAN